MSRHLVADDSFRLHNGNGCSFVFNFEISKMLLLILHYFQIGPCALCRASEVQKLTPSKINYEKFRTTTKILGVKMYFEWPVFT